MNPMAISMDRAKGLILTIMAWHQMASGQDKDLTMMAWHQMTSGQDKDLTMMICLV